MTLAVLLALLLVGAAAYLGRALGIREERGRQEKRQAIEEVERAEAKAAALHDRKGIRLGTIRVKR